MYWALVWYMLAIANLVAATLYWIAGESSFEAGVSGMLALILARMLEQDL